MNRVIIVYDKEGKVLYQVDDTSIHPLGLMYVEVEIPLGKIVVGFDIEEFKAVFDDAPITEVDTLNETVIYLETRLAQAEYALMIGGLV